MKQKTLKKTISLQGVGLHNGKNVKIDIKPAAINHGIKFKRLDLRDNNLIDANFKNVKAPILCTRLENSNGVSISTIEHLMAAFYGEGIDNALVEINESEIPIMDGSAIDFVEAIKDVGTEEQDCLRKFIKILKKVEVKNGSKFISIAPLEKDLIIDFEIVYENPLIRTRRKEFSFSKGDLNTIYNSRTFCLYKDIDQIRSQGLAKGGSLDNAIVVKENEILNENGLRNRHEFVCHKILDCLGDLLLSGYRMHGHLKTSQGGHLLTNQLLRELFSNDANWKFETLDAQNKEIKDNTQQSSIAVNA
tara:strand:- start:4969 stop:5883 length:915 start_codon:yes stop_codon:yes gene_type:complete